MAATLFANCDEKHKSPGQVNQSGRQHHLSSDALAMELLLHYTSGLRGHLHRGTPLSVLDNSNTADGTIHPNYTSIFAHRGPQVVEVGGGDLLQRNRGVLH